MNLLSFPILSLTTLLWIQCVCSADMNTFHKRPYYVRPEVLTFVAQPMDQAKHIEVLSEIVLNCEVHIQSVVSGWWPHIYWRHNGSIVNSTWPTTASIKTNFWNYSVLHSPFPGSYQCVVDDGSFVLVSRVAQISLHKIYPDPNPPQWHSVEACPGQLLHLPCQPLTVEYQAQVLWQRNGVVIQESQQHTILQPGGPGDLVIYNFSHKDVGNYSCSTVFYQIITGHSVTQSNGPCTNWNDIHVVASREYIQQGENLFLVCLTRRANIRFSWLHKGEPRKNASVLQVLNTSDADLGNYTCLATTEDASAETSASIVVRRFENVSVTAQPLERWLSYSESGLVNRSIRLTCAATGSPPVVTTWFHNGRTIQGNESIIIQSGSNATQLCGIYQCFVKNLHSEASQHFRVKLYLKPNPPGIVTQHVISSGSSTRLILKWLPAEDILERSAVQYLRVKGWPSLGQRLGSHVSSTEVKLELHNTYQFSIEPFTKDISESQWSLFSSTGNASEAFSCCNPNVIGNGSIDIVSCEAEYTGRNDTVRCAFQWTVPDACKFWSKSTINVFCPNDIKRQGTGTSEHPSFGTAMNASIPSIPCNTYCNMSVSTDAWSTVSNNPISCNDETNQTFKSASIAPSQPAVIKDWKRSCNGKDVMLSVDIPSHACGDSPWYSVHYNNTPSERQPLSDQEHDVKLNVSLPYKFQWRPSSLSVMYGNSGGDSPLSNSVQVPGITPDDILSCPEYDCQQTPDTIICSFGFPQRWTSGANVQIKDVTSTLLDCNVLRQPADIKCSLEMEGCRNVGNTTVAADSKYANFKNTCHTHTYCIITRVAMETSQPVYLNTTASCNTDCRSKELKTCSASPSSSNSSAPTTADMSSQDTSYITYILIGVLILLFIILVVIFAVIAGYCFGRRKQNNEVLESLRTLSSLQESHLGTSADGRNTCSSEVDQYNLQSTVYPDDTTQYCPVNVSQTDLTSQWVEDQQKLADESEEIGADESSPLLFADFTSMGKTATISPRPNHPDGSSQTKDSHSPERTDYQYVHKLMIGNIMQQQQPSQLSGPHQTYVELQCKARTENLPPVERSTSFAATSGQSPYIPGPMFSRAGKRCSAPSRSLEDDEERFGPSLVAASDLPVQSSPSLPTTTSPTGYISMPNATNTMRGIHGHTTSPTGYISMPNPTGAMGGIHGHTTSPTGYISMPNPTGANGGPHDHSTKEDIVSQEMCKSDILEAPETPELAPGWVAPSLLWASSVHPSSDSQ